MKQWMSGDAAEERYGIRNPHIKTLAVGGLRSPFLLYTYSIVCECLLYAMQHGAPISLGLLHCHLLQVTPNGGALFSVTSPPCKVGKHICRLQSTSVYI